MPLPPIIYVVPISALCLTPMRYCITDAQFWPIAGRPVLILLVLTVAGVNLQRIPLPAYYTATGEWVKVSLYEIYQFVHILSSVGLVMLFCLRETQKVIEIEYLDLTETPVTQLALLDISLTMLLIQAMNGLLEPVSVKIYLQRILTGELNLTVMDPRKIMVRLLTMILTTFITASIYCQDERQKIRSTNVLFPSGNIFGYVTWVKMLMTGTIPLVQVYNLLYTQPWVTQTYLYSHMLVLTVVSAFMLCAGAGVISISALLVH